MSSGSDGRAAMAAPAYSRLLSPIRLGPALTLRNRVVFSPHTTAFAEPGGRLGPREAAYQAARARGGVALSVLGTSVVHPSSSTDYGVLANLDESYVPGYRLVADAVHAHGMALFAQLNHQGLCAKGGGPGRPLWAPSAVPSFIHGEVPRVLDLAALPEIVAAFAAAAARCRNAGLDGVLVHAAHGYLLNQFLSPLTNRRTDGYGGSLDHRLRLLLEVLAAIRGAVERTFVVGVRFAADEYLPGGIDRAEGLAIARRLDATGLVDYLDVSAGVDYDWMAKARHYPGMHFPEATWIDLGGAVKAAVGVPVACAGRIRDPDEAERLLAQGKVDLVQMARALIVDAEWVQRAQASAPDEIRPCLYISSGCLGRVDQGLPVRCVQSPVAGREAELGALTPAARPRRIVVVGGGPAGLEAALVAARRGHRVVLIERAAEVGGQLRTAARAPGRGELLRAVAYLERALVRLGIELCLGTEADAARVLAARPDAVVLATGSEAAPLEAPCAPGSDVASVREVLDGRARPGPRVLVVDGLGRIAAASAADFLAGQGHTVTLVTRDYAIAAHVDPTTRPAVEWRLRQGDVRTLTGVEVASVRPGGAELRDVFTGRVRTLDDIDTVVHDHGGRAREALERPLAAAGVEVHRVGDCLAPRGLEEAFHEGHLAGRAL